MIKKWLYKANRAVIWLLLFVTIIYLLSGFSLTHHYYAYKIIPQNIASKIHVPFCWAFLTLFLLHSIISAYFAALRPSVKTVLSIRTARWSAWLLLASTFMMIISGYSITRTISIMPSITAISVHNIFSLLVIPFFILHAGICSYRFFRK